MTRFEVRATESNTLLQHSLRLAGQPESLCSPTPDTPGIVVSRKESGLWDWLDPATPFARSIEGLPLGLIPGTDYVQVAVQLNRNDVMILYTDGIIDATDRAGNMLGGDGLLEIARNLPVESPAPHSTRSARGNAEFSGKCTEG
jgi:hypothetical protein